FLIFNFFSFSSPCCSSMLLNRHHHALRSRNTMFNFASTSHSIHHIPFYHTPYHTTTYQKIPEA
ncbi:hypothetical protein PP707_06580, partial [Acetobacter pasteurianus]|nr:hypothetical protein [Acetobacter pasteurianus]